MPCDTINRMSVNLELRADNREHLEAALRNLGYQVIDRNGVLTFYGNGVTGTFENGKLKINGRDNDVERFDVNEVKRAYSGEVVKAGMKKCGWKVSKINSTSKFTVQKQRIS